MNDNPETEKPIDPKKYKLTPEAVAGMIEAFSKPNADSFGNRLATAAATAAQEFCCGAFLNTRDIVQEMRERSGFNFPDGDRVITAGLLCAASIMVDFMVESYGDEAAVNMTQLANQIRDGVKAAVKYRIAEAESGDPAKRGVAVLYNDDNGNIGVKISDTKVN